MPTIALFNRCIRSLLVGALLLAVLGACGKQEAPKPPEKIVNATLAPVVVKDLPIAEAAVGAETAIGLALDYDPTRLAGGTFYVRLPFPEHVANRLKIGQTVTLSSFSDPAMTVPGKIREIRPALDSTTLSREVIVAASGGWRPAGSIRGEVVLGVRKHALVVPEQAVVLRPAGGVVYVAEGETVKERVVQQGVQRGGEIEIVSGLNAGENVVVDGAAQLTDGAKIKVRDGQSAPSSPAGNGK
jgi:multidrug efflux pump subunit AcrA (membrane-fusion protein)